MLVIDDDAITRDTYVRLLELDGFQAQAAEGGVRGLALAVETGFDVILCDLRLPDISGLEVLSRLKARGVSARVVIVTRFPEIDSSFEAGARGAVGFISGMLIGDELISVVTRAIHGPLPVRLPSVHLGAGCNDQEPDTRLTHADPEIRRLLDVFEKEPSLPVKSLAEMLGIGESTLRLRFKTRMKTPVGRFLAQRRLDLAARRLASSGEHVATIAKYVGMSDVHYFRRVFRQRFGLSPKAYRRRFSV